MGITLGKKQLNKGRVSLYLNYSYNGKRRKEYLGIILDAPTSAERRAENRNKVLIARQIRAKKELEFLSVEYHLNDIENTFDDILPTDKSNVPDFYILIGQYLDTYHKKDKKMVRACITHLRLFTRKKSLPVTLLTKDFCINFLEYLRDHLRGNTPIGYFKKFRMCINKCIEKKLMTSNPTDGIRLMQFDEVTKAILSLKEIQKLAITPCPNNEVKRAFLFSCYCGLRWCDVHQLQYKDIDFSSNRLTILQQKVQSHSKNAILHLNLNHTAIKLLQRHKGINEELVFGLPSYAAFKNGTSINPETPEEVDEVVETLKAQKPLVQAYVMDEIFDKMIGGEAAIGVYYSGDAITMIDDNPDLAWVFPEEGSVLSVDCMAVPATSEHKEAAEMFINFMCEPDIGKANAEYIGYTTPMQKVWDILDEDLKYSEIAYPSEEVEAKEKVFTALSDEVNNELDIKWSEMKSYDEGGSGVVFLMLLLAMVALACFNIWRKLRKKTRNQY